MATISLIALLVVIVISFIKKINAGILAIPFAFIIGTYFVEDMTAKNVIAGFPTSLIFTLLGIMFLFGIASSNGTMDNIAQIISNMAGSKVKLIPFIFYFFSVAVSCCVGGIIGGSLVCPIAMKVGKREGIPDFITGTAVIFGVQGGAMTSIAANGVIARGLMEQIGMPSRMLPLWLHMMISALICFTVCFLVGGGAKLKPMTLEGTVREKITFDSKQKITVVGLLAMIILTAVFKTDVPLTGFTIGAILILLGCGDTNEAIKKISWPTIMLLAGVSMLVNVIKVAGGIDAASAWLASIMTPSTANSIMVLTGGAMSAVSSATGVVMPTLIPTAPEIAAQLGNLVSVESLVSGIIIGANIVPISPLSTMGGIAIACSNEGTDKDKLFRGFLISAVLSVIGCAVLALTGFYSLFW